MILDGTGVFAQKPPAFPVYPGADPYTFGGPRTYIPNQVQASYSTEAPLAEIMIYYNTALPEYGWIKSSDCRYEQYIGDTKYLLQVNYSDGSGVTYGETIISIVEWRGRARWGCSDL